MIYKEYFELTEKYTREYGESALVLMQVGTFYEMYGLRDPESGAIMRGKSRIQAATEACMLRVAEKKDGFFIKGEKEREEKEAPVLMAGFGECSLDKYLPILVEAGFTCVVYVQEDDITSSKNKKKRVLHGIYSVGTFFQASTEVSELAQENTVMAVWIHRYRPLRKTQDNYVCSFAVASVATGESSLYEYTTPCITRSAHLVATSFDELERAISSFAPRELVFIYEPSSQELVQGQLDEGPDKTGESILQYIGAKDRCTIIHRYRESDPRVANCAKPAYIQAILAAHFGAEAHAVCQEFARYESATQTYCFLLEFLKQHSPHIVDQIRLPHFSNTSKRLVLGNHTLTQLNVLAPHNKGAKGSRLSSLSQHLNWAVTPMGRRMFHRHLLNPVFDADWLNAEYAAIQRAIDAKKNTDKVAALLSGVKDTDFALRSVVQFKAPPAVVFSLHHTAATVCTIFTECGEFVGAYPIPPVGNSQSTAEEWFTEGCVEEARAFIQTLGQTVCIDELEKGELVFRKGVDADLDSLQEVCAATKADLESFRCGLNRVIHAGTGLGKSAGAEPADHVKWHETAKQGASFQITAARGKNLQRVMAGSAAEHLTLESGLQISYSDVRVVSGQGASDVVQCAPAAALFRKLAAAEDRLAERKRQVYEGKVLRRIAADWLPFLHTCSKVLARCDVLQSKALAAVKYAYCRPAIATETHTKNAEKPRFAQFAYNPEEEPSYLVAKGLRHPLIEHLQTNEIYVSNDVALGELQGCRGFLLYGTNAVGKTSLIKATGLAVIMAQAGMYVPCDSFEYRPYEAIYSRILGNDDMFKGLSTFAIEMSELRTILIEASPRSLVLGDEVCSGTETESALSIFTAALQHLYKRRATFIFATHFHEIAGYKELQEDMADAVHTKHMSVTYDAALGALVYDRRLRDGSGPAIYGLEVAKSLFMPEDFLADAFRLREKYFPVQGGSALLQTKTRYNAATVRKPLCEVCNKGLGEEIHHLAPQHTAGPDDSIIRMGAEETPFHKNHAANLVTVCAACHDRIHAADPQKKPRIRKTKTTQGYVLTPA